MGWKALCLVLRRAVVLAAAVPVNARVVYPGCHEKLKAVMAERSASITEIVAIGHAVM